MSILQGCEDRFSEEYLGRLHASFTAFISRYFDRGVKRLAFRRMAQEPGPIGIPHQVFEVFAVQHQDSIAGYPKRGLWDLFTGYSDAISLKKRPD